MSQLSNEAKEIADAVAAVAASARTHSGRRAFVDCGFNTCRVLEAFVEGLAEDFVFYGFEVQAELAALAETMRAKYPARIFDLCCAAVGIADGTVASYEATSWGVNFKGGTTTVPGKRSMGIDYENPRTVRSIDFSAWLSRTFAPEDFVAVKMDVEGAEYDVLEKAIADETIDIVDILIVEFHWHRFRNRSINRARHQALLDALQTRTRLIRWH